MDAVAPITIAGKHEVKPEWLTANKYFDVKLSKRTCYGQRFYVEQKPSVGGRWKCNKRASAFLQQQLVSDLVAQGLL